MVLAEGLLDAAMSFDYRMPELYGGDDRKPGSPAPLAYPAACRPQGWSAASGVAVLSALLGLRPDVTRRTLVARPAVPGAMEVIGLALGDQRLSVAVAASGKWSFTELPDGWRGGSG